MTYREYFRKKRELLITIANTSDLGQKKELQDQLHTLDGADPEHADKYLRQYPTER